MKFKTFFLICCTIILIFKKIYPEKIYDYSDSFNSNILESINNHSTETKKESVFEYTLNNLNQEKISLLIEQLFTNTLVKKHPSRPILYIKTLSKNKQKIIQYLDKINKIEKNISLLIEIYEISYQNQKIVDSILKPLEENIIINQKISLKEFKQLSKKNNIKTLAKPSLMVKNNHIASISIGDKIPYITTTTLSTNTNTLTDSLNQLQTGIDIKLRPNIIDSKRININLNIKINTIKSWNKIIINNYPTLSSRTIKTEVISNSNEHFLIMGLKNKTVQKAESYVPILKFFPILKKLFKSKKKETYNTDIIIKVTTKLKN